MKAPIEHTLKFLDFWKEGNYAEMYRLLSITWRASHTMDQFKTMLPKELPSEFRITGVEEPAPHISDVAFCIKIGGKKRNLTGRLLKEVEPYRLSNEGEWGLNPVSILRGLYDKADFLQSAKSKSQSKYHK